MQARFSDATRTPKEKQSATFLQRLSSSSLHAGTVEDARPNVRQFFLIGAASWSAYDMHFLDTLDAAFRRGILSTEEVYVRVFDFDSESWGRQDQLDEYLPGLKRDSIFDSSVIGHWVDDECVFLHHGARARQHVLKKLNIRATRPDFRALRASAS